MARKWLDCFLLEKFMADTAILRTNMANNQTVAGDQEPGKKFRWTSPNIVDT